MQTFLAVLGVVYAAVFIWLTIRIVNRPKAWRTWIGVAVPFAVAPLLGMVCLISMDSMDGRSRRPAKRSLCKNNLKQIGLALHNYADAYGSLPPACLVDGNGRPMHSWRVLILPFLDQAPLFKKYRFDEPWDGPNNRKLADMILPVFNCPSDDHAGAGESSTMTNYVAIVGPETVWPGAGATARGDIQDGAANTLMVVEVANSGIHWMEPRDLHVSQMAPSVNAKSGQGISSRHTGGANVLIADGAVRFIPNHLSADELRAWLTAHAGDITQEF